MRLEGKVALITGAAGGIGHAVAGLFASEGAIVIAADIKPPAKPYAGDVETIMLDETREEQWASAVAAIVRKHGRLDVLINNAGIIAYEPLDKLEMKDWQKMIAVDQTGVIFCQSFISSR